MRFSTSSLIVIGVYLLNTVFANADHATSKHATVAKPGRRASAGLLNKRATCPDDDYLPCLDDASRCCPMGGACCNDGEHCCDEGEYCHEVDGRLLGCCEIGKLCA
ncbi:hypothetical protein AGABI1DRAFT_127652 [Agaricus bisporus var. burnettii JB137-S8]|uniref:Granulins domain-containing protein n=2 Tax=Agaricus bisporus var. burnettii TaxID=192524 RepID=K5WWV2_AGABU|nr:uncharacterized protein AGABI1DRAFT_127652 [Agaricus bisporus var. burnettii JB137-S8]EKM79971.1 hypothetical protein AGABI1DRAFT_127652 [Agaricus bisporus var. burnettii JB137-S8]KAF7775806.1 hypothetical protein Agabi119p4_4199 [Agaricus bisporus var. burnettii]